MLQKPTHILASLFGIALVITMLGAGEKPDKSKRFDFIVRGEMFDGFAGDTAALARAMALCEDTLHVNPDHAQALVWHGSAIWYLSGQAFQQGNVQRGMALSDSGMREMDRALALAPDQIGVIIPHGASILAAAPYIPGPYGKSLMQKGTADYEKALGLQRAHLDQLSVHSRGELLGGLANAYRVMGDTVKARYFFKKLTTELAGSDYAKLAKKWLALPDMTSKSVSLKPTTCVGCHTE